MNAFLDFSSNITLAGLTSSILNSNAQLAIINATATSMQLAMSNVIYTGSAPAPVATTIAAVHVVPQAGGGVTLIAETKTTVTVTGSNNANSLYTQYTTALTNAVASSAYTQSLQAASKAYGATVTSSASATGVTSSQASVQSVGNANSNNSDDSLSDGAIAGIVIGSIVGMALIAGLMYYLIFVSMNYSKPLAAQGAGASSSASPAGTRLAEKV